MLLMCNLAAFFGANSPQSKNCFYIWGTCDKKNVTPNSFLDTVRFSPQQAVFYSPKR
jgi:hypothetical protein